MKQAPLILAVAGLIVASAGVAILGTPTSPSSEVRAKPGDVVRFHLTAMEPDGDVLYTTNWSLAETEIEAGNKWLDPNESSLNYGIRQGELVLRPLTSPDELEGVHASRYLLDHQEGDVVHTPILTNPLGNPSEYLLPTKIGPVSLEFSVNLSNTSHYEGTWNRSDFVVGNQLEYTHSIRLEVTRVVDETAWLTALANDGDVIFSRTLGMNLTIEEAGPGLAYLVPMVEPGLIFETRGCELPENIIPPGRYRVRSIHQAGSQIEAYPEFQHHLFNNTFRFTFEIVEIDGRGDSLSSYAASVLHAILNGED